MSYEEMTLPVTCKGVANVYVNAFGEHVIPENIVAEAIRLNAGKSIFDERTRGYKHMKIWMKQKDIESEKEWRSQ